MQHLENALVVVTRYYGGIHLGADRFKVSRSIVVFALPPAAMYSV
jgi:putative IMPACT (imprinted ancient) family translation regulator